MEGGRYQYDDAFVAAEVLKNRLLPACESAIVCGSIRRRMPTISDIDIVLLPLYDDLPTDLFGEVATTMEPIYSKLTQTLNMLVNAHEIEPDTRCQGQKQKRFTITNRYTNPPISVDLFIANKQNFGYITALRTGPADFMRSLVTRIDNGGLMPNHLRHSNGYLWFDPLNTKFGKPEIIRCPSEETYFRALKLDYVEPSHRTDETADLIRKARNLPIIKKESESGRDNLYSAKHDPTLAR